MLRKLAALAAFAIAAPLLAASIKPLDIGGGTMLDLDDGWQVKSYRNMAMSSPEVSKALSDAREFRLSQGSSQVMISYMTMNPVPGKDGLEIDGVKILRQVMQVHLPSTTETTIEPVVVTNGAVKIAYATLHAKPGKSVSVSAGVVGGCVTTATIVHAFAVQAIDIVSETCDTPTHAAFVVALSNAHS